MNDEPEPTPQPQTLENLLTGLSNASGTSDDYVPTTDIELTHEVVLQLFDEMNIKMTSDLSEQEIKGILKLEILNKILFGGTDSILRILINNVLALKVSKNRLGRSELISAISNVESSEDGIRRGFKRFLG